MPIVCLLTLMNSTGRKTSNRCNELLCDAFGRTEIGVLIDRNGDGFIKPADDGPVAAVRGPAGGASFAPDETDLPAGGIRAGVLFYSAGRGANPTDLILSWK